MQRSRTAALCTEPPIGTIKNNPTAAYRREPSRQAIDQLGHVIVLRGGEDGALWQSEVYDTVVEAAAVAEHMISNGSIFVSCYAVSAN